MTFSRSFVNCAKTPINSETTKHTRWNYTLMQCFQTSLNVNCEKTILFINHILLAVWSCYCLWLWNKGSGISASTGRRGCGGSITKCVPIHHWKEQRPGRRESRAYLIFTGAGNVIQGGATVLHKGSRREIITRWNVMGIPPEPKQE
jgi:hypothetical protein